ncbi:hypothetical protein [Acinetobacter tianfuensis]|uniref:Uncharacterized protein n=1 Tax=Acinetobacter tianfuensis TaxID=2419603 RepID=A0A3A8EE02_9GAMM|nr:hypothetical protein [Acinetobacter tianfuensis]RKG31736.1 hypothetical protein D7V32_07400 [Acinetobacter tianfuensis]
MLDFWYSPRCTREIKLAVCIAVCALIYYCSSIQQLSPLFAAFSLAVGLGMHITHQALQKLGKNHAYAHKLKTAATLWPVIALTVISMNLPQEQQLILALQCVGFSAIGLFLVSIYENRAKRFN